MARKNFDKDFKLGALNLVVKQKRPVLAVAKELGIHETKVGRSFFFWCLDNFFLDDLNQTRHGILSVE